MPQYSSIRQRGLEFAAGLAKLTSQLSSPLCASHVPDQRRSHLRWAGHVSRMPLSRLPPTLLTSWVASCRPLGCPQMTWGRTLKKALSSKGLPTDFTAWSQLAADRNAWRHICGGAAGQAPTITNDRQAIWAALRNGPEKT